MIELTAGGKIDIYAKDSINIHATTDINLKADRNINMEAGSAVNIKSGTNTNIQSGSEMNLKVGADGKITAGGTLWLDGGPNVQLNGGGSAAAAPSPTRVPSGGGWAGAENLNPAAHTPEATDNAEGTTSPPVSADGTTAAQTPAEAGQANPPDTFQQCSTPPQNSNGDAPEETTTDPDPNETKNPEKAQVTSDLDAFGGAGPSVNDDLTKSNTSVADTDARLGIDPRGQDQRGPTTVITRGPDDGLRG